MRNPQSHPNMLLLLLFYDLELTEALVIIFKNKYSSFIVELAKQNLFYSRWNYWLQRG